MLIADHASTSTQWLRNAFCAGLTFEKKILANEANNVKFNFLRSTDPYHKYYRHKAGFSYHG